MDASFFSANPQTLTLVSCTPLSPSTICSVRRQFHGGSRSPAGSLRARRRSCGKLGFLQIRSAPLRFRAALNSHSALVVGAVVTFSAISVVYFNHHRKRRKKNGEEEHQRSSLGVGETNVQRASDDQELLKAQAHIWNHTFNFVNSMSLKWAIELSIPDTVHNHGSPMTLPELVAKLPIHPSKAVHVHRLMRILSHSGFFALQKFGHDQQGYVLTRASRLLLKDNPFNAVPFVLSTLHPSLIEPWQCMASWFQNDDPTAFETAHGTSVWEYIAREPGFARLFNESMASDASLVASIVTGSCKEVFEGVSTLVDVGGGTGTMVKAIADAFPAMECTVFDLPHVVEGLEGAKNFKFVGGDMFEAIPPANTILLKWILHDWSDEECVKILSQCKKAIESNNIGGEGGKVIIIEMVVQNHNKVDKDFIETQLFFDLDMMVLLTGKERNETQWASLFSSAGFTDYKITPALGLRSVIQVYP